MFVAREPFRSASAEGRITTLNPADRDRSRDLARMKRFALGLLILAAAAFVIFRRLEHDTGWAGYARATAEAAMVGALADWFAVTALFRHPLRLPIPHTAIIPRRKEALGRSLGEFVRDNFLTPDTVAHKLDEVDPAQRISTWLQDEDNVQLASLKASAALGASLEFLDNDDTAQGVQAFLVRRFEAIDAATLMANLIDAVMDGDHHHALYDSAIAGAISFLAENREVLRERIGHESPWFVPEFLDERVFRRLYGGIERLLADMAERPDHELRQALDVKLNEVALRLRTDETTREGAESLRQRLVDHPEFSAWLTDLWSGARTELAEAARDPSSDLHDRLRNSLTHVGELLLADQDLRQRVNLWTTETARFVVERTGDEIASLVTTTVDRWDPTEASERIELQVGKDLQYIRINGTIVGGMAGLVIHATGELIA